MPIPDFHVDEVCRAGAGALCCRYLCVDAGGWLCGKASTMKDVIDARVAAGTFTARGDNCEGWEDES